MKRIDLVCWIIIFFACLWSMSSFAFLATLDGQPFVGTGVNLRVDSLASDCPIEMLLTDPRGRRLGRSPNSGKIISEISYGVYYPRTPPAHETMFRHSLPTPRTKA